MALGVKSKPRSQRRGKRKEKRVEMKEKYGRDKEISPMTTTIYESEGLLQIV